MKRMKNLLSLVLALVMVMAMTLTAMADEPTYNITIASKESGHEYQAYQVFSGTLSGAGTKEDPYVLADVQWGSGIADGAALLAALKDPASYTEIKKTDHSADFKEADSPAEVAAVLSEKGVENDDLMQIFAELVSSHLSTTCASTDEYVGDGETKNYTISGLIPGYYFVKDAKEVDNTSLTRYLLDIVGANRTVSPKAETPKVEKKVRDANDSTPVEEGWQDSADYDVKDVVPFQLTGTLPKTIVDYDTYKYVFHDKQSDGLDFNEDSVIVTIDGKNVESGYTIVTDKSLLKDDCTFEIVFENIKNVCEELNIELGEETLDVVVTYNSTLNENATLGSAGNKNDVKLEFSNNPNARGEGETSTTPPDTVIVFTYQVIVNKVDEEGTELPGATFKLSKFKTDADGNSTMAGATGNWVEVNLTTSGDGTVFTSASLDDGYYRLEETNAPTGYNKLDGPIYVKVEAAHDVDSSDPKLTKLEVTVVDEKGQLISAGSIIDSTKSGIAAFEVAHNTDDTYSGTASTNIINMKGVTLPETGGIGTTIFTVSGIILVIIAGVLLVTKKRMSKEE